MNTYNYKVILTVEVEAFDESDAWDAVQETYGVGQDMGIKITDCEYKEVRAKSKRS